MRRAPLITLLLGLSSTSAAYAQQPAPEPEAPEAEAAPLTGEAEEDAPDDSMEALNARGFEAFERGDYVDAAAIFKAAYDIHKDPNLLKNVAIAQYAAADCERARKTALLFLKEPNASAIDREEMTRLISRCDALRDAPPDPPEEEEEPEIVPPPPVVEAPADQGTGALGAVLVGVGLAATIGTVVYHSSAYAEGEEIEQISRSGGDELRYMQLSSSVDTARVAVPILYAVSAALTGGGVWLLVSPPAAKPDAPIAETSIRVGFTTRF